MHCHGISIISLLASIPLVLRLSFANPLSPPWGDMRIKHAWDAVPENWESLGHPPSDTTIDLYLALKPHHENALIDSLYEVSSPKHPRYGNYLSKEQVAELVAPHPNTLEIVNSWLDLHHIPRSSISTTHGGNTLMLKGVSVTQANTLLDTSYQLYRYVGSSEIFVRTISYALPMVLHDHVLTVVPTTTFFPPHTQWRNRSGEAAAGPLESASGEPLTTLSHRENSIKYALTPSFLRWLYEMAEYVPSATNQNRLGIACYVMDYPSTADLLAFLKMFRANALDATYQFVPVNGGGSRPGEPTKEANIDLQIAMGLVYPTPITFYSTEDQGETDEGTSEPTIYKDDWMVIWTNFMINQENIPQTISTSYGQDEKYGSEEYSLYVCHLLAQLSGRGVSLLFPTGNYGVGPENCDFRDGSVTTFTTLPGPYVTAVGGTARSDPEEGAELSGGGFSEYFPRPPYQDEAVPPFLQSLGDQYQGMYNRDGRGIPDISAQALEFPLILKGELKWKNGTSGSAPVVASVISLLNDYQLSRGRKPLGWLNPWLYKYGFETLFDIIDGSNPGCGTPGFPAIQGWDPVTGLGTPDFGEMQDLLDVMAFRGQVP